MACAHRSPEFQPRLQADRPLESSGCHLGGAAPAESATRQPRSAGAPADHPKLECGVPCHAERSAAAAPRHWRNMQTQRNRGVRWLWLLGGALISFHLAGSAMCRQPVL